MANQWFRLYAEFANDPKIQMMSEADQRRFVMLLCARCSNGDVTLQDEEVAFQLRISNEEWALSKSLFMARNMIGDDNKPVAWDKRQFVSDSSAERVSRHRAKLKQESNVTVTAPEQNRTEQNRAELTSFCASAPDKKKEPRRTKSKGTQLPDAFAPTEAHMELAAQLGVQISEELPAFLDFHASKGTVFKDWNRGFCTWLRNARKFNGGKNGRRHESTADRRAAYLAELCSPRTTAGTIDGTAERLD